MTAASSGVPAARGTAARRRRRMTALAALAVIAAGTFRELSTSSATAGFAWRDCARGASSSASRASAVRGGSGGAEPSSSRRPYGREGGGHDVDDGDDGGGRVLLPDWRIVADCPASSLDCAVRRRGRYAEYPFRVGEGRTVSEEGRYNWTEVRRLPEGWARALREDAPLRRERLRSPPPPPPSLSFVYPPEVSPAEAAACVRTAEKEPFRRRVSSVLARLTPDPELDMVAFTITDRGYSRDMLHEAWEMARDAVGFPGGFFFVALDRYTVEEACRYGYPVAAGPGALGGSESDDDVKSLVQGAKFAASLAVVEAGRSFLFFEMDVWFLGSPKPLLRRQRTDWMVSSHQNCPFCGNIGVYSARSNDATKTFFRQCLELQAYSPETHDQILMNDIASAHEALRQGRKPNGFGRWEDPVPPVPNSTNTRHTITRSFFDPHHIAADVRPVPTEKTIAIHPLSTTPLTVPHGKKMVAKELGAWHGYRGPPGAGGGYYDRAGPRRRYLLLDGRVNGGYSMVQDAYYHDGHALAWTVAALVAVARRTGRILVLPRVVLNSAVFYLWTLLDLRSVEELGVQVRETNFPSNPKAWFNATHPFETAARTALFSGGRLFLRLPHREEEVRAWKIEPEGDRTDALFAILTAVPQVREAEALLVNPSFVDGAFGHHLLKNREAKVAEGEIRSVYRRLRWCGKTPGGMDFVPNGEVGLAFSATDCYGRGERAA